MKDHEIARIGIILGIGIFSTLLILATLGIIVESLKSIF